MYVRGAMQRDGHVLIWTDSQGPGRHCRCRQQSTSWLVAGSYTIGAHLNAFMISSDESRSPILLVII